jgi:predicted component of type VI protein secretion system
VARLVIRNGDAIEHEIELGAGDLRIGRGDQNDVVLRDPNKTVSRFHAELRHDGASYVLIDLNSQNGIWMGGRRQPKITLATDIPVTLGNYTLTLLNSPVVVTAPAADSTVRNPPADTAARLLADTKPAPSAPAPTPAPAKAASAARGTEVAKAKPAAKARATGNAAAAPGLIAYLARLPRPVLFGGFAAFIVAVVGIGQFAGTSGSSTAGSSASTAAPAVPAPSNEDMIARHLAEARALLGRSEPDEAITAHLDPILLIDPTNADALELKTRAHDLKAAAVPVEQTAATAPAPASAVAAPPPATPAPSSKRPAVSAASRAPSAVIADLNAKDKELSDRYDRARTALTAGQYQRAAAMLADLQRDRAAFRDVPQLLARARDGAQQQAQQALDEGARLEAAGDLSGAVTQFERAQQGDGAAADAAEKAIGRIRERMKTDGADAFRRARQYDALGRVPEAVALYDRAYRYLAEGDPSRQAAKERLDALRARP